jgi:hypothetical protein
MKYKFKLFLLAFIRIFNKVKRSEIKYKVEAVEEMNLRNKREFLTLNWCEYFCIELISFYFEARPK